MKASDFYQCREIVEAFGASKAFETNRRLSSVMPSWPQYSDEYNEFHSGLAIYVMAKTGSTTTPQAVYNAINQLNRLRCGEEKFYTWFGNLLCNPQACKKILSVWIYHDANYAQINHGDHLQLFQGDTTVKSVSSATCLSGAFLYDFALKLNAKSLDAETSPEFEYDGNESEDDNLNEYKK